MNMPDHPAADATRPLTPQPFAASALMTHAVPTRAIPGLLTALILAGSGLLAPAGFAQDVTLARSIRPIDPVIGSEVSWEPASGHMTRDGSTSFQARVSDGGDRHGADTRPSPEPRQETSTGARCVRPRGRLNLVQQSQYERCRRRATEGWRAVSQDVVAGSRGSG